MIKLAKEFSIDLLFFAFEYPKFEQLRLILQILTTLSHLKNLEMTPYFCGFLMYEYNFCF